MTNHVLYTIYTFAPALWWFAHSVWPTLRMNMHSFSTAIIAKENKQL